MAAFPPFQRKKSARAVASSFFRYTLKNERASALSFFPKLIHPPAPPAPPSEGRTAQSGFLRRGSGAPEVSAASGRFSEPEARHETSRRPAGSMRRLNAANLLSPERRFPPAFPLQRSLSSVLLLSLTPPRLTVPVPRRGRPRAWRKARRKVRAGRTRRGRG